MPIERIPYPEALPVNTNDYVRQNNLLEMGFLRVNDPWPVVGNNIIQGAVFQCGGTVYLATADTVIAGAPSNYVKLTPAPDGSILTPTYVANLTGVSWNKTYNGYYDIGGNLYIFSEMTALDAGQIATVKTTIGDALNKLLGLTLALTGQVTFSKRIIGGFGAYSTGGTLDWNDISNAKSGNGYTLLYGDAANGPGPHVYFHAFCFEFTTKDGTGNMTQFAIPYSTSSLAYGIYMRTRTSSVWTNWCHVISTDVDGNIQGNLVLTGTLTMPLKTSIHSTNVTENTIYDTIVPFIPNINDEILMSGSIYYAATQLLYIISKAKKTAASIITVYGILFHPDDLSVETASIQMTNGGAIVYNNVSIAI